MNQKLLRMGTFLVFRKKNMIIDPSEMGLHERIGGEHPRWNAHLSPDRYHEDNAMRIGSPPAALNQGYVNACMISNVSRG